MKNFTFAKWLTKKETFNSFSQYKTWLSIMTNDEALRTDLYYHEKFEHWRKYLQTKWD